MQSWISAIVRRRWLVLIATTLFAIFGVWRFLQLPIEAFPDVTDPRVEVVGTYPGRAAEEVERQVTLELERVLAGTPKLASVRSVSVFGLSLVTLTFEEGTREFEMRTVVDRAIRSSNLPSGASVEMGPEASPVGQIYRYTLRGPKGLRDLRALQDFVVERQLRSVPGVADVVTFGGFEREYVVRVDPVRLANMSVSVDDIFSALSKSNANSGGGYVTSGSQELIVRGIGALRKPEDLGQAVVRQTNGLPIRVRDVAEIAESSQPRRGAVGRGMNDEVVEGIVLLRRGENPSQVLDRVHAKVEVLNREILPKDVIIAPFYDRTDLVNAALSTVGKNLAEGALLVLLVVYLFLRSGRAVLIVAVCLPVSLLFAFVGLGWIGLPANLISLGAIDFGILIDGAILVVEATMHTMHKSPPASALALDGQIAKSTAQTAKAVLLSMLVMVVGLSPIAALEHVEGRIFAPMAFTYTFALTGALVSALFVVPALESLLFKRMVIVDAKWLIRANEHYKSALAFLAGARKRLAVTTVISIGCIVVLASSLGTEFLPQLNEGGLYITALFPSTIALEETTKHAHTIRERALAIPEVRDVLSQVGRPEEAPQAEGPNNAEFFVVLAPEREWRPGMTREQIEADLRKRLEEIPGVSYNFSQPITDRVYETISGIVGEVVVKVRGTDLEAMTKTAEELRGELAHVRGVTDLSVYQAGEVPQLQIELDREALARRGLSVDDVQHTLQVALGGKDATTLWRNEQHFDVAIRLPESVRTNTDALALMLVGGDAQRRVTLGDVAHIHQASGHSAIWRENLERFVALKFNVRGRDLGSAVKEAKAIGDRKKLPEGLRVYWEGEFQSQTRAMGRIGKSLPVALIVMFGVLLAYFRRTRPALVTLALVPIAIAAGAAGLRVAGEHWSVSSAVGGVALMGQVILAGMLMCRRMDDAAGHGESIAAGASIAFRPILLTATLAALGLVPAALSHSMGGETQRPFAIVIVAGLFFATPIVLFCIPTFYRPQERA